MENWNFFKSLLFQKFKIQKSFRLLKRFKILSYLIFLKKWKNFLETTLYPDWSQPVPDWWNFQLPIFCKNGEILKFQSHKITIWGSTMWACDSRLDEKYRFAHKWQHFFGSYTLCSSIIMYLHVSCLCLRPSFALFTSLLPLVHGSKRSF